MTLKLIANYVMKSCSEMVGVANRVGVWKVFKSITFRRGAGWLMTQQRIWLVFVLGATKKPIDNRIHFAAASQVAESQQRWWISAGLERFLSDVS